jgi:Flp pilus assembly protein TadG
VTTRASDERGMIGKLLVLWLLVLALIVVAAVDGVSIMLARFQLSDAATRAATSAAAALNRGQSSSEVCEIAADAVEEHQPDARFPRRDWCVVDDSEGRVTITLRTDAGTLLAGRLSFTEDWTHVSAQESVGRSSL